MTEPAAPPPPERGRPYGVLVLGAALVVGGVAWLLAAVGAFSAAPSVWLGLLLVVAGIALVAVPVGGHVGPLVALGIVLALLGTGASALDADLVAGGVGTREERPSSAADLREYDLGVGSLRVDLTRIDEPADVSARVGIGELVLIVPAGAALSGSARAGVGDVVVRELQRSGFDVELDLDLPGFGPELRLDVSVGIGSLRVRD